METSHMHVNQLHKDKQLAVVLQLTHVCLKTTSQTQSTIMHAASPMPNKQAAKLATLAASTGCPRFWHLAAVPSPEQTTCLLLAHLHVTF
jgi:hypothetical protein